MMKSVNKAIFLAAIMLIPFAGCDTDELRELNVNPNALNQINMNYLFSAAQLGAASGGSEGDNRYIDWRTNIGYTSYYIQHLANSGQGGLSAGDKYFDNVESHNAPWEFIYGGQLKNLAEVIKQTGPGGFEEGKRINTHHAARILRAFLFHRLTDYYGNIPYFDALQGIALKFYPKYDDQQAIYADILNELGNAAASMSEAHPDDGFDAADMYFKGDVSKWQKWAYSLMLRLAMRISNVDLPSANTYVTQAIAGGVMQSNADNVWVPMSETPSLWTNQNGISRAFIPGDGGQSTIMSKTLIDELKGPNKGVTTDDDPRLGILTITGKTSPLTQEGMPNGLDAATLTTYQTNTGITNFSSINPLLLDRADPYMLMSYSEVEFLQAEALERGIGSGITGTAQTHYNAGVQAAMMMLTPYDASFAVTQAQVDAYLAARPYPTAGTLAERLNAIGTQMWISKFFNWWDAWADWRRSGYPVLTPVNYPGNVSGGQIPRKLRYPTHEHAVNSESIAANATLPDEPTTRVWWDGGN